VHPKRSHPLGAYVEAVQSGSLLFLSGMLPIKDGKPQYIGRLGRELDADAGRDALRTATLNALFRCERTSGFLDRVRKVVRVESTWLHPETFYQSAPSSRMQHRNFSAMYLGRA